MEVIEDVKKAIEDYKSGGNKWQSLLKKHKPLVNRVLKNPKGLAMFKSMKKDWGIIGGYKALIQIDKQLNKIS